MRLVVGALLLAHACSNSPPSLAEDDPSDPPAAGRNWRTEVTALEERAARAEAERRLEDALELRASAVTVARENAPDSAEVAATLNQSAITLHALGRHGDALPLLEESVARWRRLVPGDHPNTAAGMGNLAAVLQALGRRAEALPLLVESLAMARRLSPGDHRRVALGLDLLAETLESLGRVAEALPLREEALAMWRRLLPGDHPEVAAAISGLGGALEALGRLAEALPLDRDSLAMRRRLFPGDHPEMARGVNTLAVTLEALGRAPEALPLFEESLAIRRRLHPGDHPEVASVLHNLAWTLRALGRAPEALPHLEESLAMRRRLVPGDDRQVALDLNNLALTLEDLGQAARALPILEESLAMRRRLLPPDHPEVALGLESLAVTLDSLGRMAEALPLKEEALAMKRRSFPGDHPAVASALGNLAVSLASLGRTAEGLPLEEESLAMTRRLYPGEHPDVALGLNNLAGSLEALGRVDEALPYREEALAMRRRLFPSDHPHVASSINNLACTLEFLGRPAEALPLKEEALAMWRRLYPGDHPRISLGLNNLGVALDAMGRADEARAFYDEAFAMDMRLGSPDLWRRGAMLGHHLLRRERAAEAVGPLRTAIDALEAKRSTARGLSAEGRARFVEAMREWADPFGVLIRAYLALSDRDAALETLERGRGRELLDLLYGAESDPTSLAQERARARGDEPALRAIDAAARDREAAEAEVVRRERETERARGRSAPRREVAAFADAESEARRALLRALAAERRLVKDVLPEARPLAAAELRELLAPDELMLAYSFGRDDAVVFLASRRSVESVRLEADGRPVTPRDVQDAVRRYREVLLDPGADVVAAGRRLCSLVVPAAVYERVRGARRLHLIPEGPLEAVPFETLVVGDREGTPVHWADDGPPIAYQVSGSVLSWLRTRPEGGQAGPDLVILGDPVFAGARRGIDRPSDGVLLTEVRPDGQARGLGLRPGDVLRSYDGRPLKDGADLRQAIDSAGEGRREIAVGYGRDGEIGEVLATSGRLGVSIAMEPPAVAGPRFLAGGQVAIALRSAGERSRRLVPLPGTRTEVEGIAGALRTRLEEGARITTLVGREATESALFESAAGARYLHLATHGIVDETETASFSALALTMPAVPVPGDDGFLTLMDLFQRWQGRLAGTELVVLSACESARGKEQRFEGAYALPWGFLFAGARAVVASRWKVDDEATAFLMEEFYRRMLDGTEPLDALAAARLATKANHPHPCRWGAFVFAGAPR